MQNLKLPTYADVSIIEKAREYAIQCHTSTNHFYDKIHPYSFHLKMVVSAAEKFIHLIPEHEKENVIAACWLHDVIEDCRQTYNDVKNHTNEKVADLVYALTNEKGRNREERANAKYYKGIQQIPYAPFIKLCDRIANFQYSKSEGSPMYGKYKREMPDFVKKVSCHLYIEMLELLE